MFTDRPTVTDPPRRRWRFWLLLIGTPVLVAVLSAVGWVLRANSGLQSAIDEADRLDPRWRWEDIQADRANFPSGQNGADKIVAIHRLKPASWPASKIDELFVDLPPERQLNKLQIIGLKLLLQPAGPALAEARSLIDTPRGRHPITYNPNFIGTLLPTIQATREGVALLRYDVYDKAQAGDIDGAIRSCHAAIHAGCSIGDEPILIAQLVRIACQAVAINLLERASAQGEPSAAVLAAFQARLEAIEPEPLLLYGLRGERGGGFQLFQSIRDGTVSADNVMAMLGTAGPLDRLYNLPGYVAAQQADHLKSLTAMVEVAKLPPDQWIGPFADRQPKAREMPTLARLIAPALDIMARACQRNHACLLAPSSPSPRNAIAEPTANGPRRRMNS